MTVTVTVTVTVKFDNALLQNGGQGHVSILHCVLKQTEFEFTRPEIEKVVFEGVLFGARKPQPRTCKV
jgi:hypothetical protein